MIRRTDATEVARTANLIAYTAREHYTIRNSHFSKPAEALVATTYKRGEGKTYKVLSRSGPSLLANGVMDRLLREETQMSQPGALEQAVITSANYNMKLAGQESLSGRVCDMLDLIPKRKSPYLLRGRMWVDATDKMLVKIEGKPAVSLSFFEGRPQIVREYRTIAGFALAVRSHATSRNFLFGQSTVDIEYRDYHVVTLGDLSQKTSPR